MYEGLIEFIESSVFTLANQITADEADGATQCEKLVEMLLAFAEKNPGMVRVMTGDALVGEHERLQVRMNQFFDRFESTLKQSLRVSSDGDAARARGGPGRATRSAACTSTRRAASPRSLPKASPRSGVTCWPDPKQGQTTFSPRRRSE